MVITEVIRVSAPSMYARTRSLPFQYSTQTQVSGTKAILILSVTDVRFEIGKHAEIRGKVPLSFRDQEHNRLVITPESLLIDDLVEPFLG